MDYDRRRRLPARDDYGVAMTAVVAAVPVMFPGQPRRLIPSTPSGLAPPVPPMRTAGRPDIIAIVVAVVTDAEPAVVAIHTGAVAAVAVVRLPVSSALSPNRRR